MAPRYWGRAEGSPDCSSFPATAIPVLVASADGVGTKLKIAAQLGHFESIGQDLVTLNVNDILTKGAKPLFFLDYVSFSTLDQQRMETLLRGITWGCREVGCALIGGETAQMPGMYSDDDFDLAGFLVGVAEKDGLLNNADHSARRLPGRNPLQRTPYQRLFPGPPGVQHRRRSLGPVRPF